MVVFVFFYMVVGCRFSYGCKSFFDGFVEFLGRIYIQVGWVVKSNDVFNKIRMVLCNFMSVDFVEILFNQ